MKRIVLVLVVLAMAMPVLADDLYLENCYHVQRLAEGIMGARQRNANMSDVMNIIKTGTEGHEELSRIGVELVINAYSQPMFSLDQNKANEIMRFKNQVYLECIKQNR